MTEAVSLSQEIDEAAEKAIDSLARYKFAMFGYWAGIWVHLNRIEGKKRPSPFRVLVKTAREIQKNEREARVRTHMDLVNEIAGQIEGHRCNPKGVWR